MTLVILLDAGPLGLVTNPKRSPQSLACTQWLQFAVDRNARIILPEIADYEVRHELLRAAKTKGIAHLNALGELLEYLPITTSAMRQAALHAHIALFHAKPGRAHQVRVVFGKGIRVTR